MVRSAPVPRIRIGSRTRSPRAASPARGPRLALLLLVSALLLPVPPLVGTAAAADPPSTVILISLDGTTPEQVRDPALPTLEAMIREGAAAERLIPAFPTNTFPNHVTFATGVAPERHGIVNNVFRDPERGRFSYENDPTWIRVEPLWSLAGRHGVVSAAFHWVGSQGPWRSGRGPRHWVPFDAGTPAREKVERILGWLDLEDPAERPRLITSWLPGADRAGHRHGPGAPEVRRALRRQDAELGRLVEGIAERGLWPSTTLLVVSDHGMLAVERRVDLRAALEAAGVDARVLGAGGFATLVAADPEAASRAVGVARELGLEAWRRERAPAGLPVDDPRFGDAVVLAPPGTVIGRGDASGWLARLRAWLGGSSGGAHGYRPELPGMAGIFLARGAGVPPGAPLGAVRAVDVAPTVLALLGLPVPERMEGTPLLGRGDAVPSAP